MRYYAILFMVMSITKSVVYAQEEDSLYYEQPEQPVEYGDVEYSDEEPYTDPSYYPRVSPEEVSQKKGYDTEPIDVKRFDHKKWEKVVGGEDYSEAVPAKKPKQPAIDSASSQSSSRSNKRFEQGQYDEPEESETNDPPGSPIASSALNMIVYVLAIGIIGYILFLIIKNISLKSKGKVTKTDLPDHSVHVEDIKELEIDRLLREAMTSGNYRVVIRIYFLGLLQKLDEDGFILWKKDKTNRDYLTELFSKAHYFEEVRSLTLAYEQVWYGDHTFPVQTYEQIISEFKAIDQKLKTSKPQ